MAKEVAISKRLKISEAQQYMILAVLGASLVLGAAIAMTSHFIDQISLNTRVIMAEEESIVSYSEVIKSTGVCEAPANGTTYSDSELKSCDPDAIDPDDKKISGTLRAEILNNLASNQALESVPNTDNSDCINSRGRAYTYKELMEEYKKASGDTELLKQASNRIKSCSALRVIPDALPAFRNEEALLASLNKLYLEANWEPENISSSGSAAKTSGLAENLNEIAVSSRIEADSGTARTALTNIERSIRDFNFQRATIEWTSSSSLSLYFEANAYYINEASITETDKVISTEGQ